MVSASSTTQCVYRGVKNIVAQSEAKVAGQMLTKTTFDKEANAVNKDQGRRSTCLAVLIYDASQIVQVRGKGVKILSDAAKRIISGANPGRAIPHAVKDDMRPPFMAPSIDPLLYSNVRGTVPSETNNRNSFHSGAHAVATLVRP